MRVQKPGAQLDKLNEFNGYLGTNLWTKNNVKEILADLNIPAQEPDLQGLNSGQIRLLEILVSNPDTESNEKKLMRLSGYKTYTVKRYLYVLRKKGLI